jgi:hypothetical protein
MYILNASEYDRLMRDKDDNYVLLVLGILIFGNYIIYKLGKIFISIKKRNKKFT